MDTLAVLVDAALSIEKVRVRTQVRKTHLELDGRSDPETDALLGKLTDIEEYVDDRVAAIIKEHPAYPWFSRVKGIGKENIGKVVGQIRVKPMQDQVMNEETGLMETRDLPFADTISALWKFAGYAPVDGHAEKRVKGGGKLEYNATLRTMCWRLGSSLMRANGKFYAYYCQEKDRYVEVYTNQGIKIVPAASLPKDSEGKRRENPSVMSEGHIHNQALRKMIKLFLSCLWLEWRKAEGLPLTKPYAIDQLAHTSFIDPWSMVDR